MTLRFLIPALLCAAPLWATPQVVTDTDMTAALVHAVAGQAPDVIAKGLADPHHIALTPSQARLLSRADIVFWMGSAAMPWMDTALAAINPQAPVDLSQTPDLTLWPVREHHSEDDEEEHDDHGHDHGHDGTTDIHLWMDPANGARWLHRIGQALAQHDPENAALYVQNAQAASQQLADGIGRVKAVLDTQTRPVLLAHDDLQYAERALDLDVVGAISNSHAAAPGARRLAELAQLLDNTDIGCLLVRPGQAATHAVPLFEARDIPIVHVAPPTGHGLAYYLSQFEHLADALANCQ